jgi:hypothetical protein
MFARKVAALCRIPTCPEVRLPLPRKSGRIAEADLFETYEKIQGIESAVWRKTRSVHREQAKLIDRDPFTEARVKPAPRQRRVFFHTL